MRSSSISHHDSSVLSPLIQRRTSLTAHQHAITISPASPLSATFPSTISTTTLDSAGLSVTSDHADFPSSSPQLKFQQSEWKKKKSDSTLLPHAVPLPKALAWRPKGGIDGRDRRPTSGGGRRAWRICFLLAFVPLSGLVLLLLSSARSSPTSTSSLAASSSRSATSHHAHAVASRVSSWGRLLRSSSRQRKNTLRSPHHTYAFAVPLPNDDPHGAAYEEHPIHGLIREAKEKWEEKKKAQKETCEEAMEEYKRRYGRKVPDGFQHWFVFVFFLFSSFLLFSSFSLIALLSAFPPSRLHTADAPLPLSPSLARIAGGIGRSRTKFTSSTTTTKSTRPSSPSSPSSPPSYDDAFRSSRTILRTREGITRS